MRIKTSELDGRYLDVAVAKYEGLNPRWKRAWLTEKNPFWSTNPNMVDGYINVHADGVASGSIPRYSKDWAVAGPILEREGINVTRRYQDIWDAHIRPQFYSSGTKGVHCDVLLSGPTPLVAAMRCLVAARLGDEVELEEAVACIKN